MGEHIFIFDETECHAHESFRYLRCGQTRSNFVQECLSGLLFLLILGTTIDLVRRNVMRENRVDSSRKAVRFA